MQRVSIPASAAAFLVLLRLAIGWHFAFEGWHKVHSFQVGETTRATAAGNRTVKPFSSEGYFREANGPLGGAFRSALGDPDDELLARLDVQPIPSGQDPVPYTPHRRIPPALARDWEDYLARFVQHYGLTDEQKAAARVKLEQAEDNFVVWLTTKDKAVTKSFPTGSVEAVEPNTDRVAEYRDKVRRVREAYARELPAFGKDVERERLTQDKRDVARLRASLQADVDEQTAAMKQGLADVLTPQQREREPVPAGEGSRFLHYLDHTTAWFLLVAGGLLLAGLFTRLACVAAGGFLLLTYLCTPAFPWLPVPPNAEGFYFYVNKNVVEMLALFALALTPSGRWFGLDAVLHELWAAARGVPRERPPAREPRAYARAPR
jgi:uncharacterized membrane protein YphA (DoxX/SURF4 family)